jgi:uncharacterized protein YkwD
LNLTFLNFKKLNDMSKRMFCIINLLVFSFCTISAQAKMVKTTTQDTVKTTLKTKTPTAVATKSVATKTTQKATPSVKTKSKTTAKSKSKSKMATKTPVKTTPSVSKQAAVAPTAAKPPVQITSKGVGLVPQSSAIPMSFNNQMLFEINALRKSGTTCGGEKMPPVKALAWNTKLENAATVHVTDMDGNDRFSHEGTDGKKPDERIEAAGYQWQSVGENIGQGYKDIASAMKAWKESANHCKQLMSAEVTEVGAAKKGKYWCQAFAKPLD